MRHIGTLSDAGLAERVSAYLTVNGIANHIDEDGGNFDVWVKDEDRVDDAMTEFESFEKSPNDGKYINAVTQAQDLIEKEIERRRKVKENVVKVSESWPQGAKRKAPLTIALVILSVAVSVFSGMWRTPLPDEVRQGVFFKSLSFVAVEGDAAQNIAKETGNDDLKRRWASLQRFELWRLITPIFIHFGVMHLAFNMFMLYQFGRILEDRYGTLFLGMLVLLAAAIPNFLQGTVPGVIDGSWPDLITSNLLLSRFGGMSGVVYGLFGYAWIRSSLDPSCGFMISQVSVAIMIGWLLLGFTEFDRTWLGVDMANWGHGGGLVIGMAVAYYNVMIQSRK